MLVSKSAFVNYRQKDVCWTIAKMTDNAFDIFPSFQFLSRASLSTPVDNRSLERRFSQRKRIKPKDRNKIGTSML